MKLNQCFRPIFAIAFLLILFFGSASIFAQNFEPYYLKRADWFEPYQEEMSTEAALVGIVQPPGRIIFLNIFAKQQSSDNYSWVVQNFPMPLFERAQEIAFWFSLLDIGIEPGMDIPAIDIFVMDEEYLLEMPGNIPLSNFRPLEIAPRPFVIGSEGMLNEPTVEFDQFEPYLIDFTTIDVEQIIENYREYVVYRGCDVPNVDLDSATNNPESVPGYAGDKNACGPAGAANSLDWLEKVHDEIKTDLRLRDKLVELSKLMGRENNSGVTTKEFIQGKLAFIDKHKLPISVKFQSSYIDRGEDIDSPEDDYGHSADNQSRSDNDKHELSWSWLYNEMKGGEDVEIGMDFYEWDGQQWVYKGGHIATVSGVSQIGGVKRIWLKDDADQAAAGGTEQNGLTWRTIGDYELPLLDEWSKGNKACVVSNVISESYDPNVQFSLNRKSMKFNRIKIPDEDGMEFTTAGNFSAVQIPTDNEEFVNIVARVPDSEKTSWIVDNMKIYPYDIPVHKSYDFNLDSLSADSPWELEELEIQISVTDGILKEPRIIEDMWMTVPLDIDEFVTGSVSSGTLSNASGSYTTRLKIRDIWREIRNPEYDSTFSRTVNINHGCTFTNIDLDSSSHGPDSETGYAGDKNACAPASAANSLQWLQKKHSELEFPESVDEVREKLEEISGMMDREDNKGTGAVDFIEGKMQFIEKHKLKIKVKFQGIYYHDSTEISANSSTFGLKAECKNDSSGSYPTREWLENEIKEGEDVEIAYGKYAITIPAGGINGFRMDLRRVGGHRIAVTGISDDGGVVKIRYKHDRNQDRGNDSNHTDTREDEKAWHTFRTDRGNIVIFGPPWADSHGQTYIRVVEDVVSESYDENVQFSVNEGSMEMNQTNMVEPDEGENTTGSYFSALFPPNDELKYLQVFGKLQEGDEAEWLIPNMPIPPFHNTRSMAYGVDLARIGVTDGEDIETMHIGFSVTDNLWEEPKEPGKWKEIEVGTVEYDVPSGFQLNDDIDLEPEDIPELVFDVSAETRDTVYHGCDIPNIDLNDREYGDDDVEGYAGDRNACGPAAAANSLHWLEQTHDELEETDSLRGKLYKLSRYMQRQRNQGVTSVVDFVRGKLAYIDAHRLPIKVKFQSYEIPADSVISSPDATNGRGYGHSARNERDEDSQFPTWDWLVNEMQEGEDVEMLLAWRGSDGNLRGHAVTVTGVANTGDVKRIWIKDDTRQRREGLGRARRRHIDENGEELLEWRTDRQGRPYIRRYGRGTRFIHSVISESYDPSVQFRVQRGSAGFNQYNFIDPIGEPVSSKGNFILEFNPGEELGYVNVMARLDEITEPYWLIRNMPAPPFDEYHMVSYGINYDRLGIENGQRLDKIQYSLNVSDDYWIQPNPIADWEEAVVELADVNFGDGGKPGDEKDTVKTEKLGDQIYEMTAVEASIVYRGCKVPNIDLDSTKHDLWTDPLNDGDKNACGPAAAANSMQWLEKVHKEIDTKISHRKKMNELSDLMDREHEEGVTTTQLTKGKLKFIQKYKLPIEVKYQSKWFKKNYVIKSTDSSGNELKAVNKNTKDNGYPSWEFLKKEMQEGEDVEILYGRYDTNGVRKGGHWVTVTGLFQIGGAKSIWIKDDLKQTGEGLGRKTRDRDSVGEECIHWDTTSTGIPILKRWGTSNRRVESIVSESYKKPAPKALKIKKVGKRTIQKPVKIAKAGKGTVLYEESGQIGENPLYGNVIARKPDGDKEFWILRNAIISPKEEDREGYYWFDFEMMEKEIQQIQQLDEIEISIFVSEDPWEMQQPGGDWQEIPLEADDYYVANGLEENALVAVSPKDILIYSKPDNIEYIYRDVSAYQPDLDASDDDPQYTADYAGDEAAGGPAAAAASMHYIDAMSTEFETGTELRQSLELISEFAGRWDGSGVTISGLVSGKLMFIDSLQIPVSVEYQTPAIEDDTLFSPDGRYGHYAMKQPGNDEDYPTWDYLKQELNDDHGIDLCLQWISPDGKALAGNVVSVAGISNAAGENSLWIVEDSRQDAQGGLARHFLTWIDGQDGQPILYEWSIGDTLCYVVGIISQRYDEDVTFDVESVEGGQQSIMPEINISRNPSEKGESISITVNMPEGGDTELSIYNINGRAAKTYGGKYLETGSHVFVWDGTDDKGATVPSGSYIIVLSLNDRQTVSKIVKW